jgi:protein-S-isoprenylcysteine O-methyltransferase Ste14
LIAPSALLIPLSIAWLVSEIILARTKHSKAMDAKREHASLVILWITISISISAGVMIGMQGTGRFLPRSAVIAATGIALIVLGLVLRWIAILSLGRQFTVDVAITQGHQLVRAGIYKVLRHPSYAGSLLSFLGLGLAFSNYLSVVTIFVPICVAFVYRIHVEEKTLVATFGDEYLKYRASTKGLVPGIW